MSERDILKLKKNYFDFQINKIFLAGIVLQGSEIKNLRQGKISLDGSYVSFERKEVFLNNINLRDYLAKNLNKGTKNETKKKRKLLLNSKEIDYLQREVKSSSFVVIPLRLFINERGWAKVEICLAKRLRKYEIKRDLKEKEIKRMIERESYRD